jgi:hypothetical protein
MERFSTPFVTTCVTLEFFYPKLSIIGRSCTVLAAAMPVPKAAVHKKRDATTRKHNIRIAWQVLSMHSKSMTHSMQF